jgi:hypothetical protein
MTLDPERTQTRPVKVVLGDALDELRAREAKLLCFEGELAEVRAAIKALAKLVETERHPRATTVNPAGDTKARILKVVAASMDPLTREQIADLIGRPAGGWLSMLLKKLVVAGELAEVEPGRYGTPVKFEVAA